MTTTLMTIIRIFHWFFNILSLFYEGEKIVCTSCPNQKSTYSVILDPKVTTDYSCIFSVPRPGL